MHVDEKLLTLDEWIELAMTPEKKRKHLILDCQFPTDEHLEEYLKTIDKRSDKEIKSLLSQFLIPCGHLGHDEHVKESILAMDPERRKTILEISSFIRRLFNMSKDSHPWQGITWIVDLLPHWPQEAINALDAYFQAHCQMMPDGRMQGLSDAKAIIKRKYLEHNLPVKETLLNLTPRDFELLVAYLFMKKGYDTNITPRSKDGGYDVIAEKQNDREHERLHIECKRYEEKVGVKIVRAVLGTLIIRNATKAIIVTSSSFTETAKKEAYESKRLELMDLKAFDSDMRSFTSIDWPSHVSQYLMEIRKSYNKQIEVTGNSLCLFS